MGGTSLILTCLSLGMILSVSRGVQQQKMQLEAGIAAEDINTDETAADEG